MAKEKLDLRNELQQLRFDLGFLQKIDCTKEENNTYKKMLKNKESLPNGVCQYRDSSGTYDSFFTVWDSGLTDAEKQAYIQYQELLLIKNTNTLIYKIKNCVVFFTVLTVISLIILIVISCLP